MNPHKDKQHIDHKSTGTFGNTSKKSTEMTFGILFDMDGVLVHSNPLHEIAINTFCKNHDKVVTESFLREKIYGRTNMEWIPELFPGITKELALAYADEKEVLFREIFDRANGRDASSVVIPGLMPFLEMLRNNGIAMVVATSAPRENADFILEKLGVGSFFNAILSSEDVATGKPHPDIYLKASRRISFSPSQCIVIEDSVAGVDAGKAAGAKVIGVTSTHSSEDLASSDLIIADFRELTLQSLKGLISG